ncbi:metallophosphoesterase [Marininema halotolerans]|uniref:Calcineurin-like phosphoesterase domain-containing protein n=1 Tax=Marininema halotolerans TaxID=1155944 RepID=A0A1I6P6Y1_9BACL|nr:metallophosphoesterase [Marininema halotolerans]SFS35939.1 hypothetical protein SAMN05444972_101398 [Marininema halotolerans]
MQKPMTRRRFLKNVATWLFGSLAFTSLYSYTFEPRWIETNSLTIRLPRLPASFTGCKVVQFSDLHAAHHISINDIHEIVSKINRLQPDIVLFTGDLLDAPSDIPYLPQVVDQLAKIKAPLGKFAILGNHDYEAGVDKVSAAYAQAGFQLLLNENHPIQRGDDILYLIGLDDCLYGAPNLAKPLNNISDETCKILLVHEPDFADQLPPAIIDMQLSGHSHGGQIAFPFIGPVLTPPMAKKYPTGRYQVKDTLVYTNRGLGTTILPLRFCARPELTLFTLAQSN